jgi:hypothetical protein
MVMPAIGVAADAIVRKGRVFAIVAFAVLLVGLPGNVSYVNTYTRAQEHSTALYRTTVLDLPRLPQSQAAPRPFEPLPQISIGWLRDGVASGRIPAPSRVTDTQRAAAALLLAVRATAPRTKLRGSCRTIGRPTIIDLHERETLQVLGAEFTIVPPSGPIAGTYSRVYRPYTALTPESGPVSFRLVPRSGPRATVCGPSDAFAGESS